MNCPHNNEAASATLLTRGVEFQLRGKRKAKEQLEREAPAGGAKKSKKQKAKQLAEELAKKKATNRDPSNAGLRGVNGVAAPTADQSGIVFSKFDFSTAQRVNAKKKKGSATPMQMLAKVRESRFPVSVSKFP